MDHRYNGRHLPQARRTVDETSGGRRRKRQRNRRKRLLPAAAALTIAGALIGGVGAAVHFSSPSVSNEAVGEYNPADFAPPADRDAAVDRGSRDGERTPAASCEASSYQAKTTASGEKFDAEALTAAHGDLPLGTKVRVTNVATGSQVVVRVNDRRAGDCLALSAAALRTIASVGARAVDVRYEVLG